jgi:hypothetical protein
VFNQAGISRDPPAPPPAVNPGEIIPTANMPFNLAGEAQDEGKSAVQIAEEKAARDAAIKAEQDKQNDLPFRSVDQTETPEFKAWFGDSKVVDAQGKPMVVYHGTNADFSIPAGRPGSIVARYGKGGIWFSQNSQLAERFIGGGRDSPGRVTQGSNVVPAYLSISNPLDLTKIGARDSISLEGFLEAAGIPKSEHLAILNRMEEILAPIREEAFRGFKEGAAKPLKGTLAIGIPKTDAEILAKHESVYRFAEDNALQTILSERGYDGIKAFEKIGYNPDAARGAKRVLSKNDTQVESITWLPFSAPQIKSAIGNRGTFDPNNPDITARSISFDPVPPPSNPAVEADRTKQFQVTMARLVSNGANVQAMSRELLIQQTGEEIQ